ncbi:MAG: AMP-binding protein [Ramlibacter sp.]|nr:AMP-binding protein [Ramlibacter sp.]
MNTDFDEISEQRSDEAHAGRERRVAAALRAELRLAMARAAAVWRDCGVEPGDSVAIALASHAETIVACLGVARAGGVAVLVDAACSPAEMEQLRAQGGWRFILAESREGQASAMRDFVLTRAEWRQALETAAPLTGSPATIAA